MAKYDYDLLVIGAGSGGVRAARLAAMSGARVAVAESGMVGGTCVIRGCVPKKLMVYASEFAHYAKLAEAYGWSASNATFDWKRFIKTKDMEISRLSGLYVANLHKAGAQLLHGKASFIDAHTIRIDGEDERTVTADKVLIAVGGKPVCPPDLEGSDGIITSNEAFYLPELPKSILIVGGGYIAVEFAGIFNGLGSKVALMVRGPNILRGFDDDVRAHLSDQLVKRGIDVIVGHQLDKIERVEGGVKATVTGGFERVVDYVMFATGRKPLIDGLNLDAAGVAINAEGAVVVDDYSKTNIANIWAVGDVTDRINLTPVAIREAVAFVETEFRNNPTSYDHDHVASAVFSQPPVGVVGMTEFDARQKFGKVDIYRTVFRPMKTGFAGSEERALMKLVVDAATDRVVGVHVICPDAPEMIQLAAIAVKAGLTKAQWDATTAVHPTAAEEMVTLREKYVPLDLGG